MNETMIVSVMKDAIQTALTIAAPILGVSIVVGLVISIFQATTQIQEQTLTFVPKLIAVAVVGIFTASWMGHQIVDFTVRIFNTISNIVH